jgi:hypothetical protein
MQSVRGAVRSARSLTHDQRALATMLAASLRLDHLGPPSGFVP